MALLNLEELLKEVEETDCKLPPHFIDGEEYEEWLRKELIKDNK